MNDELNLVKESWKVLNNPYTDVQVRIGVMGSAGGEVSEIISEKLVSKAEISDNCCGK